MVGAITKWMGVEIAQSRVSLARWSEEIDRMVAV